MHRIQANLDSMAARANLSVWLHAQKLVIQTFWTSKVLEYIEDGILEARKIAFDTGFLHE